MNNDYDRGCSLEVTITDPQPVVKLIMFLNGEEVIAEVIERTCGDLITLVNPLRVMVQSTSSDGEERSSTIAFTDWMPLSENRSIDVRKSFIATITTPLDSIAKSYHNG